MKKRFNRGISLLLAMMFLLGCAGAGAENARKKVTVMVYMCGADLEWENTQGTRSLSAMYASRYNPDEVNVIVLCGGTPKWFAGLNAEVLSVVDVSKSGRRSVTAVDELPLASMADPETLTAFLNYCYEKYPAESYDLVIWDHGGGPLGGVCEDHLFKKDTMKTTEIAKALRDSTFANKGLDLLMMSACLMGSAEVAAELAPYAKYYVASEDSNYGLPFDWLNGIEKETPEETAKRIVDSGFAFNKEKTEAQQKNLTTSFAAINLDAMPALQAAVDDFFGEITPQVSVESFTAISGHRRDAQAFGSDDRAGYDLDLVDLGDLVEHYQNDAPEQAKALMTALENAVVYRRGVNENCFGLTVFHPFRNKDHAESFLQAYASLRFSDHYLDYLRHFVSLLTGQPLADWTQLVSGRAEVNKDMRTLFILPLTPEQAREYGESSIRVLQKVEDGSYSFAFMSRETSLREERVTGEYVHNAIFPADTEGNRLAGAVAYTVNKQGQRVIPAVLIKHAGEENGEMIHQALITCGYDPDTRKLVPGGVQVLDETMGGYTSAFGTVFSDYDEIQLTFVSRKETRNEQGTLLPFDAWTETASQTWTHAIDGSWAFASIANALEEENLYLTFEVTDSQNNQYSSDLLQIGKPGPASVTIAYDDADMIRINVENTNATLLDGGLMLSLEVVNLTEKESIIALGNLTLNGTPAEETAKAYGTGPNWGLLKDEVQSLRLGVPANHLPEETLTEMTFDLELQDAADGSVTGTVPVRVSMNPERTE